MEEKFLNKKSKFSNMDLLRLKVDLIIIIRLIMEVFLEDLILYHKEFKILIQIHHSSWNM